MTVWTLRAVTGALRSTIAAHGPITTETVNSAAKRIVGQVTKGDVGEGGGLQPNGGATVPAVLPSGRYQTIVADPPWPYSSHGQHLPRNDPDYRPNSWDSPNWGPGTTNHYDTMQIPDLMALCPSADTNAHLYLWTTNSFMVEAHEIARAWGFKPKTILTWTKVKPDGQPSIGTGYYFRSATEHVLFAVRGSLPLKVRNLPTGYLWPRLAHSVKPDAFYDLVEKASPGPYLELFARRARLGDWHYWGDQSLGTAGMPDAA